MNETRVTFNKCHPDPGITISTTLDENNDVVNLLSIDAQAKYNETIIVCAANIQGGGSNDTTPVKLLIQGEPATAWCVSNQKRLPDDDIWQFNW